MLISYRNCLLILKEHHGANLVHMYRKLTLVLTFTNPRPSVSRGQIYFRSGSPPLSLRCPLGAVVDERRGQHGRVTPPTLAADQREGRAERERRREIARQAQFAPLAFEISGQRRNQIEFELTKSCGRQLHSQE